MRKRFIIFFGQDDKTIWLGYSMNFYDGCRIRLDRFENPETEELDKCVRSVSYTHLTLPTKRIV